MQRLYIVFFHWLPLAAAITGICGSMYLVVQYSFRASLNDPQIQMVGDAVRALEAGSVPAEVVPRHLFDAGKSLSPFIAVYDESGNPLESSAYIDGKPPKPPEGVFKSARETGENRVTWQPNPETRIALVVRPVTMESGYFVAAGRNMREVEAREAVLTDIVGFSYGAILILTFLLEFLGDYLRRRGQS